MFVVHWFVGEVVSPFLFSVDSNSILSHTTPIIESASSWKCLIPSFVFVMLSPYPVRFVYLDLSGLRRSVAGLGCLGSDLYVLSCI